MVYNLGEALPGELMVEILSRIKIKNLSRLKCVSKSWNRLISQDASFHMMHREKSIHKSHFLNLVHWADNPDDEANPTLGFAYADMEDEGTVFRVNSVFSLPCLLMASFPPVCCDLFCFATGWNVYVCNPTMKDVHVLPKSPSTHGPSNFVVDHVIGFGYVVSRKEYVVVNMTRKIIVPNQKDDHQQQQRATGEISTEMYIFGPQSTDPARSRWRITKHESPRWVKHAGGFVVGENMYWLITNNDIIGYEDYSLFDNFIRRGNELVLCMDIKSEKFDIIPPPPGWEIETDNMKDDWIRLVDIKGTLCVTDWSVLMKDSVLEFWALKGGPRDCWVKEISIDMEIGFPGVELNSRVMFFKSSKEGDIVMCSSVPNKFYIFNVDKGRLVRVTDGFFDEDSTLLLGFCWESFYTL
ncbi:OLC1v1028132C1 [Oldenlandia corymbosa var. corymbosa]|uniref:OLC1v1028132C1 n=1 Tax=Oldenlandia corymbosa var. corymbosa TaxID=529605 RepID=A0AAV1CDR1_OLDCO|nr:OLC1v1028132C1 [Oldenlandia corymbosa var. corymbosa]